MAGRTSRNSHPHPASGWSATRIGDLDNDLAKGALARQRCVSVIREEDRETTNRNGDPQVGSIFDETDVVSCIELAVRCAAQRARSPTNDVVALQRHVYIDVAFVILEAGPVRALAIGVDNNCGERPPIVGADG